MKKIFIPVAVVVIILMIAAVILSKTSPTGNQGDSNYNQGYHIHADGETHYGEH